MSKRDEDDGLLDDSESDGGFEPPKKRKKTDSKKSFIDDAAEESGEEGDDNDEDEEDDDENNDYVKDGFVVDEDEEENKKKDDLEDSDEDDDDEDDDDDGPRKTSDAEATRKRLKKVRKMRETDMLDEDDLALIQEAQASEDRRADSGYDAAQRQRVLARSEAELRRGLFADQEDEDEAPRSVRRPERVEEYDEYDDGFIEDDIGDQGEIRASERRGGMFDDDDDAREVSEAQLNEASEIFGTDYLEFMAAEQPDEDEEELMGKYRERGVGVDMGDESEEDDMSEDDDLFGDDDDDDALDGETAQQKAEALKLKREKRALAKAERRRAAFQKKAERRKAQLRKAFEPVQLVENFCTDRDDDIRQTDIPERFYDWKTPFHGSEEDGLTESERIQAEWIAERIPQVCAEVVNSTNDDEKTRIFQSIANALRFMHRDKLEPAFLKHYRKDYIQSASVREKLYDIMDEDAEWDHMRNARKKVEELFAEINAAMETEQSQNVDVEKLKNLQEDLKEAEEQLNETAKQETQVQHELEALGAAHDDDDDDELFGDDNEDDGEVSILCCYI